MVALEPHSGSNVASALSESCPEVQQIWIYFEEREEAENLARLCRGCRRPKLVPRVVEPPARPPWRKFLKEHLSATRPPPPYRPEDWEAFWSDVDALLTATLANCTMAKARLQRVASSSDSKDSFRHLQAMRWPSLLVTDREQLCKAASDVHLQASLAEAVRVKVSDLLPVLRSPDFGLLTGILVVEPALASSSSMVLKAADAASATEAHYACQPYKLRLGLYRLKPRPRVEDIAGGKEAYGARCLAIAANGRCAYAAVSTDGVVAVEASGPWEVINGQIVIGGKTDEAIVWHVRFSSSRRHILEAQTYEEAIHIALEDLTEYFEPPVDPAVCASEASDHFRLLLRAEGALEIHLEDVETRSHSIARHGHPSPHHGGLMLDATFSRPSSAARPAPSPSASLAVAEPSNIVFMRTPLHALLSLATAGSSEEQERPDLRPRLLGNERGLTQGAMALPKLCDSEHGSPKDGSRNPSIGRSRASSMNASVAGSAPQARLEVTPAAAAAALRRLSARHTPQVETQTCPLRPGVYTYQYGELGDDEYKSLSMRLCPTGECRYSEVSGSDSLRAAVGAVSWSVRNHTLMLTSKEAGTFGFLLREARGHRRVERAIGQLEIPVAAVLQRCSYQPFRQQTAPFLDHQPMESEYLVFGLVDPASPVLRALRCRPDRIPCHAFEYELRQHGLPCDDLISDFRYLDRNADGQISVADMRCLENYGTPVAAPETIHSLREALVACCGSLAAAFEAISAKSPTRRISFRDFDHFLASQAAIPDDREPALLRSNRAHSRELLKDWMNKTTVEDRMAVFSSMNPSNRADIDMSDFLCLSIHTSLLAVHRLQHFQSWVFEYFGTTKKAFAEVFAALDKYKAGVVTRNLFAEGAERLGYPCGRPAALSMFSLLDRNFDGEVTLKDFQRLTEFNAESVLHSMIAFAAFTKANLGGFDDFFKKLLQREKALQGVNGLDRSAVSFATFQKVCSSAGFAKVLPDVDLRMLFLFLDEASGKHADGFLDANEWSLLKGLTSRALTGSPARLRRVLLAEYGGMDEAFEKIHTSWLRRALPRGLRRMAIAELAHVQCEASLRHDGSHLSGQMGGSNTEQAPLASKRLGTGHALPSVRPNKACERAQSSPCSLSSVPVPSGLPPRGRPPVRLVQL